MTGEHTIQMGGIHPSWEGQWVKIKPYRSYADQQRIESSQSRGTMEMPAGANRAQRRAAAKQQASEMQLNIDRLKYGRAVVTHSVTEWGLLGWDGEPIPAPPAGLDSEMMRPDLCDAMVGAIDDYYEGLLVPEDELKLDGSS